MVELDKKLRITKEKGIHFRSMIKFNQICKSHSVTILVQKQSNKKEALSSNTLDILMLCILKGDEISIKIFGENESSVQAALNEFIHAFAS
ncbi:MAG: phosphotransferase system HPr (HPr) family protein [Colwellia sp.]|jgi:phosphotransferase system HPr (HPr) family protein